MEINWKQKLTSRKFWAAVVGFVTPVMVALGADSLPREKVISIIAGVAVLAAYIVGEGFVDAAREDKRLLKTMLCEDEEDVI